MSFDDFFEQDEGKVKATDNISGEIENELDEIAMSVVEEPVEPGPELMEEFTSQAIDMDSDAKNLFLLDVIYEPERNAAQLVFYHTETRTLYRWNDNTDHKPYFLTDISAEIILGNSKIVNSKEYVSLETVKKFDLLTNKEKEFTKIYGKTPLSIGGGNYSLRKEFSRAYEADIRYHLNYITDRQITPGTYYDIKNGKLVPSDFTIDSNISNELLNAFKGESQDALDMLDEYMPLLFQEMPDLLRCAFDIEVDSDKNNLPNSSNPIHSIISIALADTDGRKICWVLNREVVNQDEIFEGVILKRFDNEADLLEDFFGVIDEYPIVLSFNGDTFDCPYIFNRARNLAIPEADIPIIIRRTESKFKSSIHLDMYQFFKQAAIRLYAFSGKYDSASLDSLSKSLLGASKLDHPDVWINDMDLKMLVKYNVLDAELTLQLSQFDNNITLNLMFILMRISKMPIFDFSRSAVSSWLKMWIVYEHRKRGNIVPLKSDILDAKGGTATSEAIIDGKKFQGAIVLDPKPGIWWNVHVLDFASLYPSIIKTRNLSYETIRCEHEECQTNIVPEVRHWVCTKRAGIFSILLGFIRDTRVKWFKPRSGKSNEDEVDRRINDIIQSSLKVLINAGYGVFGSENFDFYCPPVAESTTAYARDAIMKTKDYVENTLGVDVIYGDSVTEDTPLLLRTNDSSIKIMRIDELCIDWRVERGKEVGNTNLLVWSENGFTEIKKVIRHKTTKQIYRIVTHTGIIDVTEDHSLLDVDGNKLKPNQVEIGSELLHSFPVNLEGTLSSISKTEAFVYGLFYADGSCGKYDSKWSFKYSWAINNSDYSLLEKAKSFLYERNELNLNYKILDTMKSSGVYKLVPTGGLKDITLKYRSLFYNFSAQKNVPNVILNSKTEIQQSFFDGYFAGDGSRIERETVGNIRMSNKGKIGSLGLYYITRSIGYKTSLNSRIDKLDIYRLTSTKSNQRKNSIAVKKIIPLGTTDNYVYDLETVNHHFHAGVGEMIVHNTDSVFIYNPTQEQIDDVTNWGINTIGIELGTDYEFRYVVFSTLKKNYFGITKDGYAIVKGLAAKKSNTPLIIRETFTEVLKILSDVHTKNELEDAKELIFDKVKDMIIRLETGKFTVEEVLTRTSLSKKITDYDTWTTSIQCVAQLINAGIKKANEFNVGDRLEYVKVRQPVTVTIPDGLAFSRGIRKTASVIPTDLIKDVSKLGGEMTITTAESTFSQILISLGLSWDKIMGVTTIDDFF